ncbi:hypothetical protein KR222_008847 [Zaprionus bogoriensis]|nr:hypothetical protein KR222_008847 [Zaprionus bogoriensis]
MSSLALSILFLGLFSVATAQHFSEQRIVNGETIDILDAPWQIGVLHQLHNHCGGAILSDRIILTAAHCLNGFHPSQLTVRAGSKYWSKGGQLIDVATFKNHENYTDEAYNNGFDIGVVLLSQPLQLNSHVRPIGLAKVLPASGSLAFVSGWGKLSYDGRKPDILQRANVKILDRETCIEHSSYKRSELNDGMFCAGGEGTDPCPSDSGGPLVYNGLIVGLVSWGEKCGSRSPVVYTSVPNFRDWLENAITHLLNSEGVDDIFHIEQEHINL